MAVTLEAGERAPAFSLPDQDGKMHRLADYRGQTVVLYFTVHDDNWPSDPSYMLVDDISVQ